MHYYYFMNLFYFHFKVQKIKCIEILEEKHKSAFQFSIVAHFLCTVFQDMWNTIFLIFFFVLRNISCNLLTV